MRAILLLFTLAGCAVSGAQLATQAPDAVFEIQAPPAEVAACVQRGVAEMDWGICPPGHGTQVGADVMVSGQRGALASFSAADQALVLRVSPAAKSTACGLLSKFREIGRQCSG